MVDLEITPSVNGTDGDVKERVITLSTGVKLKVFRPNMLALMRARQESLKRYPEPKVPEVDVPDKGRKEPNPNDPDYIRAYQDWAYQLGGRILDVFIATGSKLEDCPDDVPDADSDDFHAMVELVGEELASTPMRRYVQWVNLIAAPTLEDIQQLQSLLFTAYGATEEEVAERMEFFRSQTERATD